MQSIEDRFAIEDLLRAYALAMDFGDIEAVPALFTADGSVRDVQGRLWDAAAGGPRAFAARWIVPPGAKRGQHWIQHMRAERLADNAYRLLSYWSATQWLPNSPAPVTGALGYIPIRSCVRMGAGLSKRRLLTAGKPEAPAYCQQLTSGWAAYFLLALL